MKIILTDYNLALQAYHVKCPTSGAGLLKQPFYSQYHFIENDDGNIFQNYFERTE